MAYKLTEFDGIGKRYIKTNINEMDHSSTYHRWTQPKMLPVKRSKTLKREHYEPRHNRPEKNKEHYSVLKSE